MPKDKDGTILAIGDSIRIKNEVWKLENIGGVSFAVRYNIKGQKVETKPLRKIDFTKAKKEDHTHETTKSTTQSTDHKS